MIFSIWSICVISDSDSNILVQEHDIAKKEGIFRATRASIALNQVPQVVGKWFVRYWVPRKCQVEKNILLYVSGYRLPNLGPIHRPQSLSGLSCSWRTVMAQGLHNILFQRLCYYLCPMLVTNSISWLNMFPVTKSARWLPENPIHCQSLPENLCYVFNRVDSSLWRDVVVLSRVLCSFGSFTVWL